MKLTSTLRQAIVLAVMDDVPQPTDDEIRAEIQAAAVKAMSPEVRRLYRKNPGALRIDSAFDVADRMHLDVIVGDVDLEDIIGPWQTGRSERKATARKLSGIVNGCRTTQQLLGVLPELERYIPQCQRATENLPVAANLVADLVAMGWLRGEGGAAA
jgi:hypothetical protein